MPVAKRDMGDATSEMGTSKFIDVGAAKPGRIGGEEDSDLCGARSPLNDRE